jgi:hypothetical protein
LWRKPVTEVFVGFIVARRRRHAAYEATDIANPPPARVEFLIECEQDRRQERCWWGY